MPSVLPSQVLDEIQYHLLEVANAGQSFFSEQWTRDEVLSYFTNRQNQFLRDTAILLKRETLDYSAGQLRQPLPEDWAITQRVVWKKNPPAYTNTMTIDEFARAADSSITEADSFRIVSFGFGALSGSFPTYKELPRSDEWDADYGDPTWSNTSTPQPLVYMDEELPSLEIQIAPVPTNAGTVEVLYVYNSTSPVAGDTMRIDEFARRPDTNITAADRTRFTGVGFSIPSGGFILPDEFIPALKWGVMADMLSKVGRGQDLQRAAYCESRYQEGVEAAAIILAGWQK